MKRVLWFSRHEMTAEQRAGLGDVEVTQINRTIASAKELETEILAADIVAIVAPIGLQAEFLRLAGTRPVIISKNVREFDADGKVVFKHAGWERLLKIQGE